MTEKCPLCGNDVHNNICISCGYELPDEQDIYAPYDYDPDNYNPEDRTKPSEDTQKPVIKTRTNNPPYITGYTSANRVPQVKLFDPDHPAPPPKPPMFGSIIDAIGYILIRLCVTVVLIFYPFFGCIAGGIWLLISLADQKKIDIVLNIITVILGIIFTITGIGMVYI